MKFLNSISSILVNRHHLYDDEKFCIYKYGFVEFDYTFCNNKNKKLEKRFRFNVAIDAHFYNNHNQFCRSIIDKLFSKFIL